MSPAGRDEFVHLWYEGSSKRFGKKWFPYQKGGSIRKWYGNNEYVVDWENEGYAIKNNFDATTGRLRSHNYNGEYAFMEGLTWSAIGSNGVAFRYVPKGFLFDSAGSMGFAKETNLKYIIGILNSTISKECFSFISPTIKFMPGHIVSIPFIYKADRSEAVIKLVDSNIALSKLDWNAHETSWDFQENELVRIGRIIKKEKVSYCTLNDDLLSNKRLPFTGKDACSCNNIDFQQVISRYKELWTDRLMQLHDNEEELNRQFISIYGLEDELTPDVPMSEITILQQGEISIDNNQICWHDDVIIKQFISYIVGCYMGRYRLDRPGLAIAYPDAKPEETAPYTYGDSTFAIDEDGIIPLMASDCGFSDNGAARVAEFVGMVLGTEKQTENLNYMEQCLGKTLEAYMMKDFWRDHKRMYQNRPIYWLFASKKGTFQCIAYMHRMSAYTAERVRAKYLLPFIEHLQNRINDLNGRAVSLSTKENRHLTTLQKQLEECQEYHDRLQVIAEQAISFDLDDGVVVNYVKFGDVLAKIK